MLSMSPKPLSAGQARMYHEREFASQAQNYWSRDQQGHSEWQGKLAEQWGLEGAVGNEEFARLSEGQHPLSGEQLVRHQPQKTYENQIGKEVTSVEHRAGWDGTISAPKSVSLTALVGGDERVREAHRESVRVAVGELEQFTQARIGNVHKPETTGKFVAATFEHDTARPVDGYAAPQLHTHVVIFNVTERDGGSGKPTRSVQSHELYAAQKYVTAVYRSELAMRLQGLGYQLERGEYGQPEIKGYTKEYLEASSLRREQIQDYKREQGLDGVSAAQIAAHRTRDRKELLSAEEVLERHRDLAAQYGHQADRVVAQAREQGQRQVREPGEKAAQQAVTYARDHLFERGAVHARKDILAAALDRGMGQTTHAQVREEFERRVHAGEFRQVENIGTGPQYTTAAMLRLERETIGYMLKGNRPDAQMLVRADIRLATEDRHRELNAGQRKAVDEVFLSREKIVGLDGVAGGGKTTTLAVVREGAEASGYTVEGFAPTSRAAQKLGEAGIETRTLQAHLAQGQRVDTGEHRLYVVDESSLASTKQMHEFLSRLHPNDRVLLVGDTRQHESVEAGRIFAQLQDAGMKTVKLDEIVRQRDPELKQTVEQLARGEVGTAIEGLERQGRIHEIQGHDERITAIAKEYARSPESTLVVSPDNRSRAEINQAIHAEMQAKGIVGKDEHRVQILVPRQDLTGADRAWAARYNIGDVLRYSRGSKETGIGKGEYARVAAIEAAGNRLTVQMRDGTERSYDPRRQQGVSVYRQEERAFSTGDRVQLTAPAHELKVANRELGTVVGIGEDGRLSLNMDGGRPGGRVVELDAKKHPHLDHGYAVTSHSSQGQTAERVLIHVDTELGAKDLLNNRMAYVAVSRGAYDAQLFTNDREKLGAALGRDVSHRSALAPERTPEQSIQPRHEIAPEIERGHGMGIRM
jgi:conjugative relaxase-like TrwC/TraI family protein